MRRQLADLAPELAKVYGIKPWELRRLTVRELDAFVAHHKRLTQEQNDGG